MGLYIIVFLLSTTIKLICWAEKFIFLFFIMTTQNDRDVLNSILNPNLPLGEGVFDPEEKVPEDKTDGVCDDKIKQLDQEAVSAAESGNIEKALKLFDEEGRDDDAIVDFQAA